MRSKHRLISLFLVIFICLFQFAIPTYAESVRNKKIVSIVYDDSGSMHLNEQLKWAYANYAMQAFAGMLNREDVLMINYMSSVQQGNNTPVTIDTSNRENSVNMIRTHTTSGDTPFAAIDAAHKNLKSYHDNNSNTQYWLVVMTDGEFNSTELSKVENKLTNIADDQMPNGSSPQIIYLSMCDTQNSFTPKDNLKSNIRVKRADEAKDIAATISDISDEISGRYSVANSEIKLVNDTTIEVSSKIPLVNIGVLTQFSEAQVIDVKVDNGTNITIESNVGIKYPEAADRKTDTSLTGNVALIGNGNTNIPAGTYTITFSTPIKKENVDIMFEPAIELRLILTSDGKEIKDVSKIQTGTELCATAELYEMGTDNKIDLKLLPSGIVQSIQHTEDGSLINEISGNVMENIIVGDKKTIISANFELPGYFNLKQAYEIEPINIIITGITAELQNDGIGNRDGDDPNVIYVTELKENKTGIKYTLYIDNVAIDKETAQMVLPKFKEGIETDLKNLKVDIQDDGTFLVYPSKNRIWGWDLIYSLLHGGEHAVKVTVDGNSAEGNLNLKGGNLLADIWLLLFIIQFIMLCKRKQFFDINAEYKTGNISPRRRSPFSANDPYNPDYPRGFVAWYNIPFIAAIPIIGMLPFFITSKVKLACGFDASPTSRKKSTKGIMVHGLKDMPRTYKKYKSNSDLPLWSQKGRSDYEEDTERMSPGDYMIVSTGPNSYVEIHIEENNI